MITEKEKFSSQKILILDGKGNPVRRLNTKQVISCIEIDEQEGKGYVIAEDPDDNINVFFSISMKNKISFLLQKK
jgi:hypothetical protein